MRIVEVILKPPQDYSTSSLLLTVLIWRFWCGSYFMLFGVGILCCVSWSIVSYLLYAVANELPRLGKRDLFFCYC